MNKSATSSTNNNFQIPGQCPPENSTLRQSGDFTNHILSVVSHARQTSLESIEQKSFNISHALSQELEKAVSRSIQSVIYSPFYNEDIALQAMSINTGRILKGKRPLHLTCSSENLGALKSSIEEAKIKELTGRLRSAGSYNRILGHKILAATQVNSNSPTITELFDRFPVEVKQAGEYQAINQLSLINPKTIESDSIEVIYIIGHGEAGTPYFFDISGQGGKRKSVTEVAQEMRTIFSGKLKNSAKIKITSCESADRETLESINEIPDNASKKTKGIAPLALSMKEELSEFFPTARIFGYHGLGISRGTQYIGEARCAVSDFDDNTNQVSNFIRPSLVRKEF
ncbi:hypothetical protein MyNCGM683_07910 [Achromobacter xylosoxidans]